MMMNRYCHYSLGNMLGMGGMSFPMYHSVEPIVLISGVLYPKNGTIGFVKGIFALYDIPISGFMLRLNIAGMMILYAVLELIFGMRLKQYHI